jgi:hypothetical protein
MTATPPIHPCHAHVRKIACVTCSECLTSTDSGKSRMLRMHAFFIGKEGTPWKNTILALVRARMSCSNTQVSSYHRLDFHAAITTCLATVTETSKHSDIGGRIILTKRALVVSLLPIFPAPQKTLNLARRGLHASAVSMKHGRSMATTLAICTSAKI